MLQLSFDRLRGTALIVATLCAVVATTPLAAGARPMARGAGRPGAGGGGRQISAPTSINGRGGNAIGNRTGNNNGNRAAINSGNRVVNNNVNVNVDHGWDGCCHNGWYDHPIAAGAAFGTAVAVSGAVTRAVIGSTIYALPPACTPYNYSGYYYHCGAVWYQPVYAGSSVTYVVVNEPPH